MALKRCGGGERDRFFGFIPFLLRFLSHLMLSVIEAFRPFVLTISYHLCFRRFVWLPTRSYAYGRVLYNVTLLYISFLYSFVGSTCAHDGCGV